MVLIASLLAESVAIWSRIGYYLTDRTVGSSATSFAKNKSTRPVVVVDSIRVLFDYLLSVIGFQSWIFSVGTDDNDQSSKRTRK